MSPEEISTNMKHERKFRNHEDDWYQEHRDRERKKSRGKRREANVYDDYGGDDLTEIAQETVQEELAAQQPPKPVKPQATAFQYNESTTVEVKNYRIDLSRVKAISKEETTYNGRKSYGIRFDFMGKNGYGRDVWYGTNSKQRDEEYTKYLSIWESTPKAS